MRGAGQSSEHISKQSSGIGIYVSEAHFIERGPSPWPTSNLCRGGDDNVKTCRRR